ncbi:hypothetical protein NBRC116583_09430 [Arenicella sp. 4NH20-0111]|uniref:Hpt domain-containing protein n=1 Tax=Arenicella sp. 4NH20-0111 TaxID=3127648 RepID=UPI0031025C2A
MTDSPQIQEIKARYKASFPEKANMLSGFMRVVSTGGELTILREELHKLAGSSGMYSYDDISSLCRKAMQSIDNDQLENLHNELSQLINLVEQS